MDIARRDSIERRALQTVAFIGAWVPVLAGGSGMIFGTSVFAGPADLTFDSHFRYLSGLLFAIGIGFWSAIPQIETKTVQVRVLTGVVFTGGLARLAALLFVGMPALPMVLAIGMELVITPLLCLWQGRIARRFQPQDFPELIKHD